LLTDCFGIARIAHRLRAHAATTLAATLTPSTDQNDYNACDGYQHCNVAPTASINITGLTHGMSSASLQENLVLCNTAALGSGFNITLPVEDVGSTANRRFSFSNGAVTLAPRDCVALIYNLDPDRWMQTSPAVTGQFDLAAPVYYPSRVPTWITGDGTLKPTGTLPYQVSVASYVSFAGHPNPGVTYYAYAIWAGPTNVGSASTMLAYVRQDNWGGAWKSLSAMMPAGWYYDITATDDNGGGTLSSRLFWYEQTLQ
jgi:hypothetical protein